MISSIRTWMFNKSLKEHRNYNRASNFSGVNMCKSICIIGNGSSEQSKAATEKYKVKLESLSKSVEALYFYDIKQDTEIGYSRKSIKWNGIPQNKVIDTILSNDYDLLIYLNHTMEDHQRYLVTLCNAKFKIGPSFGDQPHLFDLMIDINDFSDTQLLISNIDTQLRLLSV